MQPCTRTPVPSHRGIATSICTSSPSQTRKAKGSAVPEPGQGPRMTAVSWAVDLAVGLARHDKRTLLVDLDPRLIASDQDGQRHLCGPESAGAWRHRLPRPDRQGDGSSHGRRGRRCRHRRCPGRQGRVAGRSHLCHRTPRWLSTATSAIRPKQMPCSIKSSVPEAVWMSWSTVPRSSRRVCFGS